MPIDLTPHNVLTKIYEAQQDIMRDWLRQNAYWIKWETRDHTHNLLTN